MPPITIGRYTFPSKKAALAEYERIRLTYPPGHDIVDPDRDFILAGMRCDEVGRSKMGRGVSRVFIRDCTGNRVIWVRDIDGRETDWSPTRAVGKAETPRARIHRYLRKAVQDQIDAFRAYQFLHEHPVVCEETQLTLRNDRTTQVDHYSPPFAELADAFIATVGAPEDIPLIERDRAPGTSIAEPHLSAWRAMHAEFANLRCLHTSANLTRGRDEPVPLGEAMDFVTRLLGARVISVECPDPYGYQAATDDMFLDFGGDTE